jgi:hypothetical protein
LVWDGSVALAGVDKLRVSATTINRDEKEGTKTRRLTLGLDIAVTLCRGTRNATEEAAVNGSMKGENTIRCEMNNAKLGIARDEGRIKKPARLYSL